VLPGVGSPTKVTIGGGSKTTREFSAEDGCHWIFHGEVPCQGRRRRGGRRVGKIQRFAASAQSGTALWFLVVGGALIAGATAAALRSILPSWLHPLDRVRACTQETGRRWRLPANPKAPMASNA